MTSTRKLTLFTFSLIFGFALTACRMDRAENFSDSKDAAIVGGKEVPNESPLSRSVALLFNRLTTEVCTVSILNNQFALTAAHCVAGADAKDLYLIFDIKLESKSITRRIVGTKTSDYYKPKLNRTANTGDIAVVRFAEGVPLGYTAAKFLSYPSLLKAQSEVTVVGYGVDDDKTRTGAGSLRTTTLQILDSGYSQTEKSLDQSRNSGVCHGDSGGPVYTSVNGTLYLWGVVSRSVNPDNCSEAAIVTDALLYLPWIKDTILSMAAEKMEIPPDDGPLFPEGV